MWLITMLVMSVIATLLWLRWSRAPKYRVDVLALICWGTTIMVLGDHIMGFVEDGVFMDYSTDALLLGALMAVLALAIWAIAIILNREVKVEKTPTAEEL